MQKKKTYETPKMDLIVFEAEDVITSSNNELPSMPAEDNFG